MPRNYKRKTNRASWSEESLLCAAEEIKAERMSIWDASKTFGIPYRTLQRRIMQNNMKKGVPGPSSSLGHEHERQLVDYIQKLEQVGYPPTRRSVRLLAYTFAEANKIVHRFNNESKMAGYDWIK